MSEHGNKRIRVLIVDVYVLLIEALYALLNKEDDFEVVGWTGTPEGTLTLAKALRPDIVLLDIALGTTNGLDLAKWLLRSLPITHRLIFTSVDDEKQLFDAMGIGVHIYLQKTLSVSEMLPAGRGAGGGRSYLPGADLRLPL